MYGHQGWWPTQTSVPSVYLKKSQNTLSQCTVPVQAPKESVLALQSPSFTKSNGEPTGADKMDGSHQLSYHQIYHRYKEERERYRP